MASMKGFFLDDVKVWRHDCFKSLYNRFGTLLMNAVITAVVCLLLKPTIANMWFFWDFGFNSVQCAWCQFG